MNVELYKANETEIYNLTGCLSNCDKFYYDTQPMTDIVVRERENEFGTEDIPEAKSVPLQYTVESAYKVTGYKVKSPIE